MISDNRLYNRVLRGLGCLLLSGLLSCDSGPSQNSSTPSLADAVLARGTIRAGYLSYPPGSLRDPSTGELSGVFVDLLEVSATGLGLEVEWVEEVGWGTMIEGLKADRYDIVGTQVWANSSRAREADFTIPIFYSGIGAYVRSDDQRFDGQLSRVNAPAVQVATIDGEMSSIIAASEFPNARTVSLPQLSPNSQAILNVVQGRADITFMEPYVAELFLRENPGSIRNIIPNDPIRIFGNTMMIPRGQEEFKNMIDTALLEQIHAGAVEELFRKYEVPDGSFYLRASPFSSTTTNERF